MSTGVPRLSGQNACGNVSLNLTSDYQFAIGASDSAGSYTWVLNGKTIAQGSTTQLGLFHYDNSLQSASGAAPSGSAGTFFLPGKYGRALAIATGGNLSYPASGNLSFQDGTIEMWIAPASDGNAPIYSQYDHTLVRYSLANGDQLVFAYSSAGQSFYAGTTVGGKFTGTGGQTISGWKTGEWHHVAFTYSAAQKRLRFYVDGIPYAENDTTVPMPAATGSTFTVDSDSYGNASAFLVDELRISNNEASASQIRYDAARNGAFGNNEVFLALSGVSTGQLSYQVTAAGATSPCSSTPYTYSGIPITNVNPPSNLLAPGSTSVALSFTTLQPTSCRYSVATLQDYSSMKPFDSGPAATTHQGIVAGLSPSPLVLNTVYLRCGSNADYAQTLKYRSASTPSGAFPRIGSIWWGGYIYSTKPDQVGKLQLLLCPGVSAQQALSVRASSPNVLIIPNVNATETSSYTIPPNVPDSYFLKDIHGNKISDWPDPGIYLLNLTKPEVGEFLAQYAYQVLEQSDFAFDGIFFDNFHATISYLTKDYLGNPVQIDANGDGLPDDPATLDAAWAAGVYHLIATFRHLVPYGYTSGHLDQRPPDPAALAVFNGEAMNGDVPKVREGLMSFGAFWQTFQSWFKQGQPPPITMVQSSPPLQIAYGYGFAPLNAIAPAAAAFGQTYYPNMRFGLVAALMNDGFSTYDFGDTGSPVNWWYDEYGFNLGQPIGPAARVVDSHAPTANLLANGGFESSLSGTWQLNVTNDGQASAVAGVDNLISAEGNASARITVKSVGTANWHVEFEQGNLPFTGGATYQLSFWARADTPRTITVISQGGAPSYPNYGLAAQVSIGTSWKLCTTSFVATATANDARLEVLVGDVAGSVWIDGVQLSLQTSVDVYRRDFSNGAVLLNGTAKPQTVSLENGFKRFSGQQAPRYQYIVDDSDPGFNATGAWNTVTIDSGFARGTVDGPGSQVANGPYYHAWQRTCHQLDVSTGTAVWNLGIPADGQYTVQVWLPAAPKAGTWSKSAVYEIVSGSNVLGTATLDQTTAGAGDQWHMIGTYTLTVAGAPFLRVHNGGTGFLIADAVYVTSAALYNDGSAATQVTLGAFDGILLQRVQPVAVPTSRVNSAVNGASFQGGIASGAWVSIFGSGFATGSRGWAGPDFKGNLLPTSLDGVSATINSQPAYVGYISPGQINVLAPDDDSIGTVTVQVTTPQGQSYSGTATKQKAAPALFTFGGAGTAYAAALHADGSLVAKPALQGRPAAPGEVISLYGTGFGATSPATPSATLVSQPAPLALPVTVTIGGVAAEVQYAGVTLAGLVQVNVKVPPNATSGDQPVLASIGGFQSAANVYLTIGVN